MQQARRWRKDRADENLEILSFAKNEEDGRHVLFLRIKRVD